MIKQIWFIRNERKLLNYFCITVAGFILFYSALSIWALSNAEFLTMANENKNIAESVIYSLMFKRYNLIILPIMSLAFSIILFIVSNHTTPFKNCNNKKSCALQKQLKRDLLIGTNLFIVLTFSFLQIDKLNTAKQIEGFGLTPIYILIAIVIVFYIIMIKKLVSSKQEV